MRRSLPALILAVVLCVAMPGCADRSTASSESEIRRDRFSGASEAGVRVVWGEPREVTMLRNERLIAQFQDRVTMQIKGGGKAAVLKQLVFEKNGRTGIFLFVQNHGRWVVISDVVVEGSVRF